MVEPCRLSSRIRSVDLCQNLASPTARTSSIEQNLRLQVRRNGERQADVHAARVVLDRSVDKFLDLGKGYDLVELARRLCAWHPEDRAVQEDVLATRQLRMKPGTDLKQTAHAAVELDAAFCRPRDTRENFEQCRLSSTIAAYKPQNFTGLNIKGNIVECPEVRLSFGGCYCLFATSASVEELSSRR